MRLRTLVFVAISLAALVGGLWYWRKAEQTATRRADAWDEEQRIDATEAVLDRRFDWPRRTVPLADFAVAIAETSGLAVDLNEGAIAAEHQEPASIWIEIPRGTLSVGSVLRLGLSPHDLCFDIDDQRLVITTPDASRDRTRMRTVVYPLPQPQGAPRHEEQWQELVASAIEPSDWDEVGGRGHIEPVPGGLVVTHTPDVQRQVVRLLAAVARLDEDATAAVTLPAWQFNDHASRARILAALAEPASLDCQALPLADLVRDLSITHSVPIYLNSLVFKGNPPNQNEPITKQIRPTSLRSLLDQLVEDLSLAYVIRDGALVITSQDDASLQPTLVAYPIRDLVTERGQTDFDGLIDLVTTSVVPDSWQDVGGSGSVRPWGDDWLLVSQSESVHHQVVDLLSQLRRALAGEGGDTIFPIAKHSAADARVEAALDQPVELNWWKTPLSTVGEELAAKLEAPVVVDAEHLKEESVGVNDVVTLDLPLLPARQALSLFLDRHDLAWMVRDGALIITTRDYIERFEYPVLLYDVRPLTDPDLGLMSAEELEQLLRAVIDVQSWDEVGGPGSINIYRGLLVVSQSDATHRRLASLLAALESNGLRGSAMNDDRPWVVAVDGAADDQRIERVLETPIDVDFCGEPLLAAVRKLASDFDLPLVLDHGELEAVLFSRKMVEATLVTHSAREQTLSGVLDRLLSFSDLGYVVRDGALVITSAETSERRQKSARLQMFRIDDLVASGQHSPQSLVEAIQIQTANYGGWESVGGPAVVRAAGRDWLITAGSTRFRAWIADILSELRTGDRPLREVERREHNAEWSESNIRRIEREAGEFLKRPEQPDERGSPLDDPFAAPPNAGKTDGN